jgi:hypothetical protein
MRSSSTGDGCDIIHNANGGDKAMTRLHALLIAIVFGGALTACSATPAASPTATPVVTPTPTLASTPVPTAVPSPTPSPTATPPTPVLTTTCDVVGSAQGGSVSWTGALANWELVIEPGDILVNPTRTSGEYGPLIAGTYTYAFRDADANDITRGQFTIAACPT